jgi:hypothetical protein
MIRVRVHIAFNLIISTLRNAVYETFTFPMTSPAPE